MVVWFICGVSFIVLLFRVMCCFDDGMCFFFFVRSVFMNCIFCFICLVVVFGLGLSFVIMLLVSWLV